jgi:2-alkyl-3-oxoalkanoate reductase
MRVFLAGGTGVIGRRLLPLLVQGGHLVTLVSRPGGKPPPPGVALASVNLFDERSVASALRSHDVVINMATRIPAGVAAFTPWGWRMNDRIRREGVRNLARAALQGGVQLFVQESYAPMYADGGDSWLTEDSPIDPSPHVRSAVDAERTVLELAHSGVRSVVLRFGLFYGPDSVHTKDMINFAKKGRAASFGDPDGYLSSVSTGDAAAAVVAALGAAGGAYNVTDDTPVTKREYFVSLAAALSAPPPRFFPYWVWRLAGSVGDSLKRSHRISNAKLKRATEWQPTDPVVTAAWPTVLRQQS